MREKETTHSEGRICSELQQTFDSQQTQVGCSDVQGSAKVKVTTGGIYFCKKKGEKQKDDIHSFIKKPFYFLNFIYLE